MIASDDGADASWSTRVAVFPRSRYRLSGWIRTAGLVAKEGGRGAQFNVHNLQDVRTPAVTGTTDWTRAEVEFDTRDEDSLTINALFGGWGLSAGRAWFDDVVLELLSRGEIPAPSVAIDATRLGEPLSPYVYGQFIEHLGRCIYGGIWAEMLEDRKFFHAVGAEGSPWRAVGAVAMNPTAPFTGEHTPEASSAVEGKAFGLSQRGLALRKGRRYDGYVWLMGDRETLPIEIVVEGGGGRYVHTVGDLDDSYRKVGFTFAAKADADDARLTITSRGVGRFRVGTASLMPGDHVRGMRPDVLALLKQLNAPIYRWPGGNFVSGYDWRDGIGDRDRRPPRKNPAWTGIETNDFGLDEFIAFCREIRTEPLCVVNTGQGDVPTAVAMLQYANGKADTPYGALRAKNGSADPYGVVYWGVGNEMFGSWQLGVVPLERYVPRHNRFVDAMRREDPGIKTIAVGALGRWSERMLAECGERMDFLSEHIYWQERDGLAAHVRQPIETLERIAAEHRRYRESVPGLKARDIRICLDEWNYWYGPEVFGELGTRYFMKDAVGCAAALHVFAKHSDLYFMCNYAQTVNVIGAIKTSKTAAAMETTGLVLKLYREKFGVLPAATATTGLVHAQATWTADRRALTLGVANPTRTRLKIPVAVTGAVLASGMRYEIAADDPQAHNDPDLPPAVAIVESPAPPPADGLELAPCSVTLFVWPVR
jgi:alpha-N-arabinofuranosidase